MKYTQNEHTITVISKVCGISTATLRVWEKRYNAFRPDRNEAGQRLYSDVDLERAKLIASLLISGHAISSLATLELFELEDLKKRTGNNKIGNRKEQTKKLLELALAFDIDGLIHEFQFQRTNIGARDFIFNVVLPVLQETGDLVAKNKLSISQEHIVSTLIRDQLNKITLPNDEGDKERFALATPEGNLHELSILIADILCRVNRVPTFYLGAAHPAQTLAEAVSALKCQTIVIGAISSDQWDYEKNLSAYLLKMDKHLKNKVRVILGGGWKMDLPKFQNIMDVRFVKSFEEFDEFLNHLI